MNKLTILLLLCGACNGKSGSSGDYTSVDNGSNARLVLVADDNWTYDDDVDWDVSCVSSAADAVVVVVDDGALLVTSTAALLGDDCTLSVRSDPVEDVVVTGDGAVDFDGPCRQLVSLDISGHGDVSLGTVETDVLDVSVTGNGSLDIAALTADKLILHLTGNGDVTLAGSVDRGEFTIGGNGYLDASDLVIGDLVITLSGNGDATVQVTGTITGEVSGNGSLVVTGGPTDQGISVNGSAAGTITFE